MRRRALRCRRELGLWCHSHDSIALLPCRGMQPSVDIATSAAKPWAPDLRSSSITVGCGALGAIVTLAATGEAASFITLSLFELVAGWMR